MGDQKPLLQVERVSLSFGGVQALADVSLDVVPGELFSIIGPNGAGKTSMLNCISGRYNPQEGRIRFEGRDVTGLRPNARADLGIGRTFQNLALFGHMTVLDNIMVGRHHLLKNNFLTGMVYWLGGAQKEELAHRREVEDIIDFLEIQHVRNAVAGDEPMAGMNLEEKEDMARYIVDLNEEWGMSVVMIEHDMGVVMDISHRVMVLDFGKTIASGLPEEVAANTHVKRAYLGEADDPDASADEEIEEHVA
jgi:branched-chain amino acid transport system ATP-binding protein